MPQVMRCGNVGYNCYDSLKHKSVINWLSVERQSFKTVRNKYAWRHDQLGGQYHKNGPSNYVEIIFWLVRY